MVLQGDVCMSDRCLCSSNIMFYYRTIASNSSYAYVQCVANSPLYQMERKKSRREKHHKLVPPSSKHTHIYNVIWAAGELWS